MNRARRIWGLLLVVLTMAGCSSKVKIEGDTPQGNEQKASDPWPAAVNELRLNSSEETCRRVLTQINTESTRFPEALPEPLTSAKIQPWVTRFRLSPDEVSEITGSSYTGLDSLYLTEMMYLRDITRSLEVTDLPPQDQAAQAFAWVCRQVYDRPWVFTDASGQTLAPPLPPTAILERGYGSGLERAYVLMSLAQQLGLDSCLIGKEGQEQSPAIQIVDGKILRGPFWAVGVRIEKEVFVFDPWRMEPVPGAEGKGIATLRTLKANPDLLKPWREDKDKPWDVPAEAVQNAAIYLSVPLSSLTPRILKLQEQLAGTLGVKLAHSPEELTSRWQDCGAPILDWAPPFQAEPFSYMRVLGSFWPRASGGYAPEGVNLKERHEVALVPSIAMVRPEGLNARDPVTMLQARAWTELKTNLIEPEFRKRIHRGQFNDVSRALVDVEGLFAKAENRARSSDAEAYIQKWVEKANLVYAQLSVARLPENARDLPAAENAVAEFWRQELGGAQMALDRSIAPIGRSEAAYLFALCKHEQAEQMQNRYLRAVQAEAAASTDRAKAEAAKRKTYIRDQAQIAWVSAKDAWDRFRSDTEKLDQITPGRREQKERLSSRADRLAKNPELGS